MSKIRKMKDKEIQEKIKELIMVKEEVRQVIESFPEENKPKKLFDKWSLMDVIAHLSNWMVHDIDCLESLKKGVEPQWEPDFDEFNMKGVEARIEWKWEKLYEEYLELTEKMTKMFETLPEDLWDTPIWKGYGLTPRKFLLKDIDHKGEHLEQLKKILKSER